MSSAACRAHFELGNELGELRLVRQPVEAPDAHVDRVDRPPADDFENAVADLLQAEPALDDGPMVAGERDGTVVAEEVRRMQHVDVQGVALDPLAAVQQTAKVGQLAADGDAAGVLDGEAGAHLISDRADATDTRRDVRRLGVGAALQECLEEARRLVDVQLHRRERTVDDRHVQGTLALDAGEGMDVEASRRTVLMRHDTASPTAEPTSRKPGAPALNVWNTLPMSPSETGTARRSRTNDVVLIVSAGP